ncbi:cupin domain-containing protein [Chitinophaga niabensis]|uniref:cupin domain-containing protein n=1 Tax=Chitinophaga niabensis TaxID=536979 RepID=UPI0031BA760E
MNNTELAPKATGPMDGPCISIQGGTYRILVSGEQTNGAFAAIEMIVPPGAGPGPHAHTDIQETFYILEGEVEFKSEAGTYTASQGAYVVIPKGGIVHAFKNKTDKIVKLLCTVVPAGLDGFFLAVGEPVTPGTFLPKKPMDEALLQKIRAAGEQFGQTIFPPDYLEK